MVEYKIISVDLDGTLLDGVMTVSAENIAAAEELVQTETAFTVNPSGEILLRSRQSGDSIRLHGGTKSLKKLFIDRKIPAHERLQIPVVCDERGILGVYSIGVNRERAADALPAVTIRFEKK